MTELHPKLTSDVLQCSTVNKSFRDSGNSGRGWIEATEIQEYNNQWQRDAVWHSWNMMFELASKTCTARSSGLIQRNGTFKSPYLRLRSFPCLPHDIFLHTMCKSYLDGENKANKPWNLVNFTNIFPVLLFLNFVRQYHRVAALILQVSISGLRDQRHDFCISCTKHISSD